MRANAAEPNNFLEGSSKRMSGQSIHDNANPDPQKPTATGETNPETAAGSAANAAAGAPGEETSQSAAAAGDPSAASVAEQRIAELEALLAEAKDRHLRAHAEMENIRKRSEREKADISKYAITNFARDMLGVSDNLNRAISAVSTTDEEHAGALKALLEGVQLTENELANALERHGVRIIEALGKQFDPNFHQAVMEQENKDVAAGSVLQVFQEGYQIGERVLRPSMVVVARGGFKPVKEPEAANDPTPAAAPAGEAAPPDGEDTARTDAGQQTDPSRSGGQNASD